MIKAPSTPLQNGQVSITNAYATNPSSVAELLRHLQQESVVRLRRRNQPVAESSQEIMS